MNFQAVGRVLFLRLFLLCTSCSLSPEEKAGGERGRASSEERAPLSGAEVKVPPAPPAETQEQEVKALFELPESAYGVTIAFDGEAIVLLSQSALHRWEPGQGLTRVPLELGAARALTSSSVIYWSEGTFWSLSKRGGEPRSLGKQPRVPQELVGARERFAWLTRAGDKSLLQTLAGRRARTLYESEGELNGLTALDGSIFFIERARDGSWRVGRVSLDGGDPGFTKPRDGRSPSSLAAGRDVVFYYDGPSRSVRSLSPDFVFDEALVERFVCSPIFASPRVFCGQVGGLYEISLDAYVPRLLAANPAGPIAALAASETQVVWVNDVGENQLQVRVLPLPERALLAR